MQTGRSSLTTTITDAKKLFVVGCLVNALLLGPSFHDVEFLTVGANTESRLLDSNWDKKTRLILGVISSSNSIK